MGIKEEAAKLRATFNDPATKIPLPGNVPYNHGQHMYDISKQLLLEYRDWAVTNDIPPSSGRFRSTKRWVLVSYDSGPDVGAKSGHQCHAAVYLSGKVEMANVSYTQIRQSVIRKVAAFNHPWTGSK
jgi:hypothetical protein